MYCPNCSAEAPTEQKFCRSCGMELQAVAALIGDQAPAVKPGSPPEPTSDARQRAMLVWGLVITFVAAAVGASLKLLAKDNIHPLGDYTPYLSVIAVVAAILGMGFIGYSALGQARPKAGSRKSALPNSAPTIRLQPELLSEEQPSVTEQTTEFLEAAKARSKAPDTAPQTE